MRWLNISLTRPLPQGERRSVFDLSLTGFLSPPGERIKVRGRLEDNQPISGKTT